MKKIKLLNITNFIVVIICLIVDIVLGFVFSFNRSFFISTTVVVMVISIINLLFILIKEASVMTYDSKKLEPVCHAIALFIATIGYYFVIHLDGFDNFAWLYWLLLLGLIGINYLSFYILIRKEEKKKRKITKGPKIMINK